VEFSKYLQLNTLAPFFGPQAQNVTFHPFSQKRPVHGFVPNLVRRSTRGHDQLCGILLQWAHGFWFCRRSKFAISFWLGRSLLTQCWRYRAACDGKMLTCISLVFMVLLISSSPWPSTCPCFCALKQCERMKCWMCRHLPAAMQWSLPQLSRVNELLKVAF